MHKLIRRASVAVAALAAGAIAFSLAGPASAKAAYAPPEVMSTSSVVVAHGGGSAFLVAVYKCSGGQAGTHLWVSAKEGPTINTTTHTSSSFATAWYDTNWNFANSEAGLTVNCDGHWKSTKFVLKPEFGRLVSGPVFVQFCLFDSTAPPNDENPSTGFAFSYTMNTAIAT